eukprot:jgi/Psemu1/58950/gm1.58950_g
MLRKFGVMCAVERSGSRDNVSSLRILIGEVYRYCFGAYNPYERIPGYYCIFNKGKVGELKRWCPYFKISGLKETNPRRIKKLSNLVRCYTKDVGIGDPTDGNVEVSESSSDTTKTGSEYTSSTKSSKI